MMFGLDIIIVVKIVVFKIVFFEQKYSSREYVEINIEYNISRECVDIS